MVQGARKEGAPESSTASFTASWKAQLEKDRLAREVGRVGIPEKGVVSEKPWFRRLVEPVARLARAALGR